MSRSLAPLLTAATLLAACHRPAARACASDGSCHPGEYCAPGAGGGICSKTNWASVRISAPAAGQLVGAPGTDVTALLTYGSGAPHPGSLTLTASDGSQVELSVASAQTTSASYRGRYVPRAGTDGNVTLVATASPGAPAQMQSPGVDIDVDTVPPLISDLSASCDSTPCLRDGMLTVTAKVQDRHALTASASLDLDNFASEQPLALASGKYSAALHLARWPFKMFDGSANWRVQATDEAGNTSVSTTVQYSGITRLRWEKSFVGNVALSVAVAGDGTILVGLQSTTGDDLIALHPDGSEAWRTQVGTSGVFQAPMASNSAAWVISNGLFAVNLADGAPANGPGCSSGAVIQGVPALLLATPETGLGAESGSLVSSSLGGACSSPSLSGSGFSRPAIDANGGVWGIDGSSMAHVAIANGSASVDWSASMAAVNYAGLALDAQGRAIVPADDHYVYRVTNNGSSGTAERLGSASGDKARNGAVIDAAGAILVGTLDGKVRRIAPDGTDLWSPPIDLGVGVGAVAMTAAGTDGAVAYAATGGGRVYALAIDGSIVWSRQFSAFAIMGINMGPAIAGRLPTLYLPFRDEGTLRAVIIDGELDPASPWPLPFHDPGNTNNAATPLP